MAYNLFKEFELISEKAWKQQIQFDLDGKDYNSETNWTSSEGINVKPFFTSEYKSINKFYIPEAKKVTILNNLNFSTSYNMASDSLN